jgi:hypothetical protein
MMKVVQAACKLCPTLEASRRACSLRHKRPASCLRSESLSAIVGIRSSCDLHITVLPGSATVRSAIPTQSEHGLRVAFDRLDLFAVKALVGPQRWETTQFRNNAVELHRSTAERAYV